MKTEVGEFIENPIMQGDEVTIPRGTVVHSTHSRRFCFWHGCPEHHRPAMRNAEFWREKVARNTERDTRKRALLEADGWTLVTVWEHEDSNVAAVAIEGLVRERRARRKR